MIPSVVFWSSGILKESLLLFAMGLFCYFIYKLATTQKWTYLLYLALPFCLLVLLKFYVFVAFFPAIIGWYYSETTRLKWISYPIVFISLVLFAILLGYVYPTFDFINILIRKQHDFIRMSIEMKVNSAIKMDFLDENIFSVLKAIPMGIVNSLTRPWPFEIKNLLFVPAAFENVTLVILIAFAFLKRSTMKNTSFNFITFCFIFTFLLYAIIGISTPILGALVRYKIPAMPFLVIAILAFIEIPNFKFLKSNKIILWARSYL
jgi:hypothetical protein